MEATRQVVYLESCCDCQKHAWACRHSPQPYSNACEQLKRVLASGDRNYHLVHNDLQLWLGLVDRRKLVDLVREQGEIYPSIGAFEVVAGEVLLYSKLLLEKFPTTSQLDLVLNYYERVKRVDPATSLFNNCKIRSYLGQEGRRLVHPSCCVFTLLTENCEVPQAGGCKIRPYNSYEQGQKMQLISNIYRVQSHKPVSLNKTTRGESVRSKLSIRVNTLNKTRLEDDNESRVSNGRVLAPIRNQPKHPPTDQNSGVSSFQKKLSVPSFNSSMYDTAQQFIRRAKAGRTMELGIR